MMQLVADDRFGHTDLTFSALVNCSGEGAVGLFLSLVNKLCFMMEEKMGEEG